MSVDAPDGHFGFYCKDLVVGHKNCFSHGRLANVHRPAENASWIYGAFESVSSHRSSIFEIHSLQIMLWVRPKDSEVAFNGFNSNQKNVLTRTITFAYTERPIKFMFDGNKMISLFQIIISLSNEFAAIDNVLVQCQI